MKKTTFFVSFMTLLLCYTQPLQQVGVCKNRIATLLVLTVYIGIQCANSQCVFQIYFLAHIALQIVYLKISCKGDGP